ncbi:MAG: glycoside hydrolase [Opitutaceae bacterium]|jgi:hypothetical protein|nr:glycoside hydrolase [Opitutaceae bacterium]
MTQTSKPSVRNDSRLIDLGQIIPAHSYCDQPYIVRASDGAWVCILTTGVGNEGDPGQVVISLRSADHGKTWEPPVLLEPADGPEASYAVLLKTPGGRIYAFYNHNTDNVREVLREDGGVYARVDSLGHHVFKYSDDHGRTWSARRYEVPIRAFALDRENAYGGALRFFWNVGRPVVTRDGAALLPHHKVGAMGAGFFAQSEGVFLRSPNILTESDPEKIVWETLPDGEAGLRPPAPDSHQPNPGRIAEEHSIVELGDGSLYSVYRTVGGYPACAYSRDGGHSWTPPAFARYDARHDATGEPRGRRHFMKHPRAANFVWKTRKPANRYLYWFHNHGGIARTSEPSWCADGAYQDRNPAWLCAGREVDSPDGAGKIIVWSEPEILLYDDDVMTRISYPDLVEEDGRFWVTETQKTIARVHEIEPRLLDLLFRQHELREPVADDSLLSAEPECAVDGDAAAETAAAGMREIAMPTLPMFRGRFDGDGLPSVASRHGFTLDFDLRVPPSPPPLSGLPAAGAGGSGETPVVLFDTFTPDGEGLRLTLAQAAAAAATATAAAASGARELVLELGDSRQRSLVCGDPIFPGAHHISILVDGGPRVAMFVVDGQLQDGGDTRRFGWGRFSPMLVHCNGTPRARVSPLVAGLKIYARALYVSEAVGSARAAGFPPPPPPPSLSPLPLPGRNP